MKKVIITVLSAALLLMGTQAKAQLSLGAGYLNSSELTSSTSSSSTEKADLNGFYAGVNYNIPIVGGLGIAPGIYGSALFGKSSSSYTGTIFNISGTSKYTEIAINAPINLNYAYQVNRDFKIFAYAGPVFQYGISSKTTVDGKASVGGITIGSDTPSQYDNYNGDNANRNPFVVYVGGGAGIQAGGLQVILGYDHSVTNITKLTNYKMGRSQIKVGVGYSF